MSTSAPDNESSQMHDSAHAPQEDSSLEQVRDLLFGSQSRKFESRLEKMQEHFNHAIEEIRGLVQNRSDLLEKHIASAVGELKAQLAASQQRSDEQNANLVQRWQQSSHEFQQHLGALSETLGATERAVRADAERQLGEFREQAQSQVDSLRSQLQGEIAQISTASVARRTLSDALKDLSARLDSE